MNSQFIFMTKNGEYVAMDHDSRVPYYTNNLFQAHVWNTINDALNYRASYEDWILYKVVSLELKEVKYKKVVKNYTYIEEL